jgi:molecular chaperone DnaK (HSP70)
MSLKVIELNDNAITVGDESGIILQSPGFALALENKIELGETAEQQARLQPTNSYNKFWHELSMEPLSQHKGIRHLADIAYAQLLHLAELGEIDSDVIFAVPGNFTRQQLAIVLGLAKQSPFNPVGLVDSALAGALSAARSAPGCTKQDGNRR